MARKAIAGVSAGWRKRSAHHDAPHLIGDAGQALVIPLGIARRRIG